MSRPPVGQVLVGDAARVLRRLPAGSVDCVVTSPPYYQLRNYDHPKQLGHEPDVDGWVDELRVVLRGLRRVLTPTGTLWLNLGDAFSRHDRYGAGPKSLLLGPERLALAMLDDGWLIRNKIVWAKPNPMPASVRDRLNTTWEPLYLAATQRRYFFDLDAIRRPHTSSRYATRSAARVAKSRPGWAGPLAGANDGLARLKATGRPGHPLGKNPGDVWRIATSNYRGPVHATYPPALLDIPILAGCPERVCATCAEPWRRQPPRQRTHLAALGELSPGCDCTSEWRPGIVLDPFIGSGTTAIAATSHERDWIGIELNPAHAEAARTRISQHQSQQRAA
ncbi:MAG: methyltransferase [Acidimicrobiales bacterium]|nr:MAG: methyltransferase [Acidimicrobiales bacterium]